MCWVGCVCVGRRGGGGGDGRHLDQLFRLHELMHKSIEFDEVQILIWVVHLAAVPRPPGLSRDSQIAAIGLCNSKTARC